MPDSIPEQSAWSGEEPVARIPHNRAADVQEGSECAVETVPTGYTCSPWLNGLSVPMHRYPNSIMPFPLDTHRMLSQAHTKRLGRMGKQKVLTELIIHKLTTGCASIHHQPWRFPARVISYSRSSWNGRSVQTGDVSHTYCRRPNAH